MRNMAVNVLFIAGSAREDGVTLKLCKMTASAMDAHIEYVMPHEMNIGHCTGCGKCSVTGTCATEDDMHRIYRSVGRSDIIILATPVYFSGPSSVMKQVIDRFQCSWVGRNGRKDRSAALIAAGGHKMPVFSGVLSSAKAFAAAVDAEWTGELLIGGTDDAVPENMSAMAYDFGSMIAAGHREKVSLPRP